jgi:hypothetical protein
VDFPEPVGPVTRMAPYFEAFECLREEAEIGEPEKDGVLPQDPQDDALAVDRRQCRDTEVELVARDREGAVTVLRLPVLGDVHIGHDLEPADDGGLSALGAAHHLVEHAVDAVPDAQVLLLRLYMDVRCPVSDRLRDHVVHKLDDRCVALDLRQSLEVVGGEVAARAHPVVRVDMLGYLVRFLDGGEDVVLRRDGRTYLVPGDDAQVVEGKHVLGVGHRHDEAVLLVEADRHEDVPAREVLGYDGDRGRVRLPLGEVDVRDADLLRHHGEDRPLGRVPEFDEDAAERAARRLVDFDGVVQLAVGDDAGLHEQLSEPLSGFRHYGEAPLRGRLTRERRSRTSYNDTAAPDRPTRRSRGGADALRTRPPSPSSGPPAERQPGAGT